MEIYERVKYIRKEVLKMTRAEFGQRLNVSSSEINNIERNCLAKPELKKPLFRLICSEFGISEKWLFQGEGEMFAPKGDEIDEILRRNNIPEGFRGIAETFFSLPEPAQQAFYDFAMAYIEKVKTKSKEDAKAELRAEVEAEAEAKLREKVEKEIRAEIEAEKEDKELEALHVLLDAQYAKEKTDKGSTLASGGTKSKEA